MKYYAPDDARRVAGVSQRCLDYWDETGVLRASGPRDYRGHRKKRGTQRWYTFNDLIGLRVVRQLREAGLSLQKIRGALTRLRRRSPTSEPTLDVLVTDGKQFQRVRRDGRIEDVLSDGQLVFGIVGLNTIHKEVTRSVNRLARARSSNVHARTSDRRAGNA